MELDSIAFHHALEFFRSPQHNGISALLQRDRQGQIRLNVALRADRDEGNALQSLTSPYTVLEPKVGTPRTIYNTLWRIYERPVDS